MNTPLQLLLEFRKRTLHTLVLFLCLFSFGFIFSEPLFHFYIYPLQHLLTAPQHLIATQITTALFTPLSIAINIALLTTTPYALWQIWRFASPALFRKERSILGFFLGGILSLFILGCVFCYFFILPFMFECFIQALPNEVVLFPDIASATEFTTHMLILFGCGFQIPLVCLLLVHLNVLDLDQCTALRPYIIVIAFILGMLLTPPDVTAQILLALPLWGLYELGLFLAHIFIKKQSALCT